MRQWQCTCGEWLDMGRAHHVHYENARQPTLEEMVQARQAGHDADALVMVSDPIIVKWSDKFARRDKPDE